MHSFGLTIRPSALLLEKKERGGGVVSSLQAATPFSRIANVSAAGTVIVTVVIDGDGVRMAII